MANKTVISTILGWAVFFIVLTTAFPLLLAVTMGGIVYVMTYGVTNNSKVIKDLKKLSDETKKYKTK